MSFHYDIFISYGHLDNLSPDGEGKGWIDLLYERLKVMLSQALGFEPVIWRDAHDLDGTDDITRAIGAGVGKSLLFVPVVTPRYVLSEWCNREVSAFHAAQPPAGDAAPEFRSRIFKVVKTPLPEEHMKREPEQVRNLLGYHFYSEDKLSGHLGEFSPEGRPKDIRYWQRLDELVNDIKNRLLALLQHSPGARAARLTSGDTPEPAPPPPRPPEGDGTEQRVVYLAETTSDLAGEREAVRDELRQRGHVVLPEQRLPLDSKDALSAAVRADLERSALSVHLIGKRYGSTPEDDDRSVVEIQEALASERCAADPSFRRFIWMPPGLMTPEMEVTGERQKEFISALQSPAAAGAELLQKTVTIEDLKTLVVDRLRPAPEPAAAPPDDEYKHVYLIFEERDWDFVEPIQSHLIGQNLDVITWFDASQGETLMQSHHKCLAECDAALIYFGSNDEFWVRKNLDDLKKAYGYGRVEDWSARAVYVGAPPNPRKKFFNAPQTLVIKSTEGFDPGKLSDFVSAVRGREGGGA